MPSNNHCAFLTAFVAARYPDFTMSIDASDATRGLNSAKRIYDFVATRLGLSKIYLIKTDSLKDLLYWNVRKFAGYPISVFSKGVRFIMTYIIPFAFVNYFPTQYFLRKPDMAQYPAFYLYLTPVIGLGMYLIAYAFWRFSLRYYKSSGN